MLDPISDTPLVLAYVFMSLLVLIVCFILFNVVHKLYRSMGVQCGGVSLKTTTETGTTTKTTRATTTTTVSAAAAAAMLELDVLKTG